MASIEIVDVSSFLGDQSSAAAVEACRKVAQSLRETSCLIIRDPRVTEEDNNNFLDMMEQYYSQSHEQKLADVHPELSYQLGATPEFTEVPRDHSQKMAALNKGSEAHVPQGPDPKWRYFWRIGERPSSTKFPELNAAQVVPAAFPNWENVMNKWGEKMLQGIQTVAQMLSVGLELPPNSILDLTTQGPHLLAPTGSDVGRFHTVGTIFAGFHYDLNLLTIHGKSRYPGLYIWLRDGSKQLVRVPDGCLLLQAGKQLEYLTAGEIVAGFHEVVFAEETKAAVERAKEAGRPLWRVSSTMFGHVASDKTLQPLGHFASATALEKYPPILAGDQVAEELKSINLSAPKA